MTETFGHFRFSLVKIALNLAKHQSICNRNDFYFIALLYVQTNISQKFIAEIRAQVPFLGQKLRKIAENWENGIFGRVLTPKGFIFLKDATNYAY